MRMLFITYMPSPYRVDFFNELGKQCNLTVLFECEYYKTRDKSWKNYSANNFRAIILDNRATCGNHTFCINVIKYLKKNQYDYIIVANPLEPTGMLAILYMRMKKIRYCIEGDGAILKPENFIKKTFKKYILRSAYLYFSTAKQHDEYYLEYEVPKEKIVRYSFSSISNSDILRLKL